MSPTTYYCWLHEHRLPWYVLRRWQPRPDQNFPVLSGLLGPLLSAALVMLFLAVLDVLMHFTSRESVPGVIYVILGVVGFTSGIAHIGFAWLTWNQRAARQRAAGTATPSPRPGWFVRWLIGPLYVLLISFVTPLALLIAVENVRGALAWREVRAGLLAKGEHLSFREIVPPAVPPEENLASLPIFANLFEYGYQTTPRSGPIEWKDTNAQRRFWIMNLPDQQLPKRGKSEERSPTTLEEWAAAFRTSISNRLAKPPKPGTDEVFQPTYPAAPDGASAARVVLTALSVADAPLREICEASRRPYARFPIHWEEEFNALLAHLAPGKGLNRHLGLRVRARLAEGDVAGAFADLQCSLRVAELFREEPLLISQLVRIAQAAIAAETIWPGIQAHQWNEAQLAELQRTLEQREFLGPMAWSLEGERAGAVAMLDRWAARLAWNPSVLQEVAAVEAVDNGSGPLPLGPLFPSGWMRQNQARIASFHQRMIELGRGLATNAPADGLSRPLREFATQTQVAVKVPATPHNVLFRQLVPALNKAFHKAARANQTAQFAATACALERHRLKHGSYPENLAALVPAYLAQAPRDLMDGQPLRYSRTPEGSFRLWSVGLDGQDNDGVARLKQPVAESPEEGLDWVWPN